MAIDSSPTIWTAEELEEVSKGNADIIQFLQESTHPFDKLQERLSSPQEKEKLTARFEEMCEFIKKENIETIFFLDKSARPAYWLFKDFWKTTFPKSPIPSIRFINYGNEKTSQDEIDISTIQKIYKNLPSGNILVVDEFKWTGTSLEKSTNLIQKSFPNKSVYGIDLEITYFVSFPSSYKGVQDRKGVDSKNTLVVEKKKDPKSNSLRSLLKHFFVDGVRK